MDSALFIIGILGNITAVFLFLSPIPTFRTIVNTRTTDQVLPDLYVFTLLNALLWLYYGVTKPEGLLIATINGFGAIVEAIYVVLFLFYAADQDIRVRTTKLAAALDVGVSGIVLAVATFVISQLQLRIRVIGIICACFNVLMYASPLTAVMRVIRRRNVDGMSFLVSFFLFLNGAVWLVYGILDRDILIGIPNGIGFFLGTIQLIVYAIYSNFIPGLQEDRLRRFFQPLAEPLLSNAGVQGQEYPTSCCHVA